MEGKVGVKERPAVIIEEMVRRVVKRFDPDKIILFGSHARGTAGPDSDVDLLVIMPVEGSKRAKRVEIRVALSGMGCPKDVFVVTSEEVRRLGGLPGTIIRPALLEGKVIYERAAFPLSIEERERLSDYAVATRYPQEEEVINRADAEDAVDLALRVREAIRIRLPQHALD
jgi:predicted nucleotidyltransferase